MNFDSILEQRDSNPVDTKQQNALLNSGRVSRRTKQLQSIAEEDPFSLASLGQSDTQPKQEQVKQTEDINFDNILGKSKKEQKQRPKPNNFNPLSSSRRTIMDEEEDDFTFDDLMGEKGAKLSQELVDPSKCIDEYREVIESRASANTRRSKRDWNPHEVVDFDQLLGQANIDKEKDEEIAKLKAEIEQQKQKDQQYEEQQVKLQKQKALCEQIEEEIKLNKVQSDIAQAEKLKEKAEIGEQKKDIQKQIDQVESESAQQRVEIEGSKERTEDLIAEIAKLTEQREAAQKLEGEITQMKLELEKQNEETKKLIPVIGQLEKQKSDLETGEQGPQALMLMVQSAKEQSEGQTDFLTQLEIRVQEAQDHIQKIDIKIDQAAQELKSELAKEIQLTASINEIELSTRSMFDDIQELRDKKQGLIVENAELEQKIKNCELRINDTEKLTEKIQNEILRKQEIMEEKKRMNQRSARLSQILNKKEQQLNQVEEQHKLHQRWSMRLEQQEMHALQTAKHAAEMRKRVENDMLAQIMQQEASANQSSIVSDQELENLESNAEPLEALEQGEMEMIAENGVNHFETINEEMTPLADNDKSFISQPSSVFQTSEIATPSNHQAETMSFSNLETMPQKSPEKPFKQLSDGGTINEDEHEDQSESLVLELEDEQKASSQGSSDQGSPMKVGQSEDKKSKTRHLSIITEKIQEEASRPKVPSNNQSQEEAKKEISTETMPNIMPKNQIQSKLNISTTPRSQLQLKHTLEQELAKIGQAKNSMLDQEICDKNQNLMHTNLSKQSEINELEKTLQRAVETLHKRLDSQRQKQSDYQKAELQRELDAARKHNQQNVILIQDLHQQQEQRDEEQKQLEISNERLEQEIEESARCAEQWLKRAIEAEAAIQDMQLQSAERI